MSVHSRTTRAADHLVEALADVGVEHIFGVSGANIEEVFDAAHRSSRMKSIVAKHEFGAATMADGYARTSKRIGVVAATSGGGALNLVAGLAESCASNIPVLALVGQPPMSQEGRGAFQDSSGRAGSLDARALFAEVSAYCVRVRSAAELEGRLTEALIAMRTGKPAVLLLPKDVLQQPCPVFLPQYLPAAPTVPNLTSIARRIDAAHGRITAIVGDGVARSDARAALNGLLTVLGANIAVTPDAKDTVDPQWPGYRGVAGVMGGPDVEAALRDSALCLLVGTRLPLMARAGLDDALAGMDVCSIGAAPPYVAAMHVSTDDLGATLHELTRSIVPHVPPSSTPMVRTLRVPSMHGEGLRYREAVHLVAAAVGSDADVFADAGNTGAAVVHHLDVDAGSRFVVALGMGGMGYSFGGAIGSSLARRRRTFVVAGDGAFYMHGMEIHTALEYNAPVTFVVFNNNAHAMCVTRGQVLPGAVNDGNRFTPASIASGLRTMFPTLRTYRATDSRQLVSAFASCRELDGPSVVEVLCDADELPPFAPFLDNQENHELTPASTH